MRTVIACIAGFLLFDTAVAADVTGTWTGDVELPNGQLLPFTAVLVQSGTSVTGRLEGINGGPGVEIRNGHAGGSLVTFSGVRMIQEMPVEFEYYGVQAGDQILFLIYRVGAEGPGALLNSLTTLVE